MAKIKLWYINLPMKKSFIALTIYSLIFATAISILTDACLFHARAEYYKSVNQKTIQNYYDLSEGNLTINFEEYFEILDKGTVLSLLIFVFPIFIFSVTMISAAYLFYSVKLKPPMLILENGAKMIAEKRLDCKIEYCSEDEMGDLCEIFDNMRLELLRRYQYEWYLTEERKRVNRAFAHDLRTPVTIIKGHLHMMRERVANGNKNNDKTFDVLDSNLQRVEKYINEMSFVQRLQDTDIEAKTIDIKEFMDYAFLDFHVLGKDNNRKVIIENYIPISTMTFDPEVVMRVLENIVSNAVRYSGQLIIITASIEKEFLTFCIDDDGKGFDNEQLQLALEPFYKDKQDTTGNHLGLGLYIARVLCEKHGGYINISNNEQGGGQVQVQFKLQDK